jgi:hypothetical protein
VLRHKAVRLPRGLATADSVCSVVIPTVILPAALVGRWWFVPVAALGWAILIVATNATADAALFFGAAAFGGANAVVGVAVHKAVVVVARETHAAARAASRRFH